MQKRKWLNILSLAAAALLPVLAGCMTSPSAGNDTLTWRHDPIAWSDYNRELKVGPEFVSVEYITIHNTAEPLTARQERDRVNARNDGMPVSFHFAVDENEAVQLLPLDHAGWHAGDGHGPGNTRSIGIEICRSQWRDRNPDWYYRSEENAARLAAYLLDYYRLPTDALRMHQDWSGKYCPHRILERDGWAYFKARVDSFRHGCIKIREIPADAPANGPEVMAILIQERNGKLFYQLPTGEGFLDPDDVAAYAAAHGNRVLISNWVRDNRCPELLESLRRAGVEVTGCFVLDSSHRDYDRPDIAGEATP